MRILNCIQIFCTEVTNSPDFVMSSTKPDVFAGTIELISMIL